MSGIQEALEKKAKVMKKADYNNHAVGSKGVVLKINPPNFDETAQSQTILEPEARRDELYENGKKAILAELEPQAEPENHSPTREDPKEKKEEPESPAPSGRQ